MVTSWHAVLFALWCTASGTEGQVGLRASSHDGEAVDLFSRWTENGPRTLASNGSSMENQLAAIFRGVAYGVSTAPTTTTSTTTAPPRRPPTFYGDQKQTPQLPRPSEMPVLPEWRRTVGGGRVGADDGLPTQHHYVESPYVDSNVDSSVFEGDSSTVDSELLNPGSDRPFGEITWISVLGIYWVVHVYTAAGLFSVLALLNLYCLARIQLSTPLLPRGYYVTIHLLIFLSSFFRCVLFFHDPYAAEGRLPSSLSSILFNTGIPCVITALALLILGLLRAARLRVLPLNLQSPIAVAIVSGALVVGSIAVDSLAGVLEQQPLAEGLRAGVQALTAGWSAALCLGIIIMYTKLEKTAARLQTDPGRITISSQPDDCSVYNRYHRSSLSVCSKLCLISAFTGLILAVLNVYGLMNSEGIVNVPPSQPWVWYGYQTPCRVMEIIMWTCISVASALPLSMSSSKRHKQTSEDGHLLNMLSCGHCISCSNVNFCGHEEQKKTVNHASSSACPSAHVVNFSIQNGGKGITQDALLTTSYPQVRYVSATVMAPNKKKSLTKSATLHPATSDMQLFWNPGNQSDNPSTGSSRPSSTLLNDGNASRLRPQIESSQQRRIPLSRTIEDLQGMGIRGTENPYHIGGYNNPIHEKLNNLSPAEKKKLQQVISSSQFQNLLEYQSDTDHYSEIPLATDSCRNEDSYNGFYSSTEAVSPSHESCRYASTCSSVSAGNSFHVRMYDDFEVASYYHGPSADASTENSGNIYTTIQRPEPHLKGRGGEGIEPSGINEGYRMSPYNGDAHYEVGKRVPPSLPEGLSRYNTEGLNGMIPRTQYHGLLQVSRNCKKSRLHDNVESLRIKRKNSEPESKVTKRNPTPDSSFVSNLLGQTESQDLYSCDDTDSGIHSQGYNRGIISKIVGANFALSSGGYSPLSSEELSYAHSSPARSDDRERHLDSGNLPLKDSSCYPVSPTSPKGVIPVQNLLNGKCPEEGSATRPAELLGDSAASSRSSPQEDWHSRQRAVVLKRTGSETSVEMRPSDQGFRPLSCTNGHLAGNVSSSRSSSVVSNSDLPSDCVDSEDEAPEGGAEVRWISSSERQV